MNVHYRLKRSEVECRELHALHCGGAERGPQAQVAALLAGRVSKLDRPGAWCEFGYPIDRKVG
jgi:hypothetical protein